VFDVGDPIPLSVEIRDAAGALANATDVVLTVTLPDNSTAAPVVTNTSAGIYTATYTAAQAGRHSVRWVATGVNASAFTDAFDVDAGSSGIVSLAEVKDHLNITGTSQDEELRLFIDAATDFIEHKVGPVVRRTITSTVTPAGGGLWLQPPVISLTTAAPANGYSGTYDVAGMFTDLDMGRVHYGSYGSTFAHPVTVTYVAGRVIVPAGIRDAALEYVRWRYASQRGATPLPLPGGGFVMSEPTTVPNRVMQALEPYLLGPAVA